MIRKLCNGISTLLLIVMLLLAAALLLPPLLGYQPLAVLSGSMEPAMTVGSMVYIREAQPADIEPGDVITFTLEGDGMYATHRVVSRDDDARQFTTKGDANNTLDAPIAFERMAGRVVFQLPFLGYVTATLQGPARVAILGGLLAVLVVLTFLPKVFEGRAEQPHAE